MSYSKPHRGLSFRERQIAMLIGLGWQRGQIADLLEIDEGTLRVQLFKLFRKIGCSSRLELAIRVQGY